jgi:hypothetical protein
MSKRRKKNRGRRRISFAKKMFLERAGYRNHHHDYARSRGGGSESSNIYLLDERRHAALHLLFGNKTFYEIAHLLIRAHNMKKGTEYFINERKEVINGLYV